MLRNKLKRMLLEGKTAFGSFVTFNSPDIVEIMALSGFDFVVIDTEHGPLSVESTQNLIVAAESRGITPITRVTEGSETTILRSLDVGTHGIQVPQVNSMETARKIVSFAKYYPDGQRGAAFPRAADYGAVSLEEYFKTANVETMVIAHCENKECLNDLEQIAAIPGIDVLFLGPFDMSQSLGIPGQVDHPLLQEIAERVVKTAEKAGKAAGIFAVNGEQAKRRAEQGFRYVTVGMDNIFLANVCRRELLAAKS